MPSITQYLYIIALLGTAMTAPVAVPSKLAQNYKYNNLQC